MRFIYGPVQDDGMWRRRYNNELYTLYEYPDVVTEFKVNRLRYAGYVKRADNNYPPNKCFNLPQGERVYRDGQEGDGRIV